jgi:hypothetical protein
MSCFEDHNDYLRDNYNFMSLSTINLDAKSWISITESYGSSKKVFASRKEQFHRNEKSCNSAILARLNNDPNPFE